jgi:hypothetical protein
MVMGVNASFDAESNSTFATAQTMASGRGAMGAIDVTSDSDWYSVDVTQPNHTIKIQSATPSDGAGEFLNTLNPILELYSPTNTLLATGLALADGRNESITLPVPIGTYRIRVGASGGTTGEYYLFAASAVATSSIATRGLFYAGATGSSASSSLSDKVALLPGQSSTFANYSNFGRGINGLAVDVSNLPGTTTNANFAASLQFATWDGINVAGFVLSSVVPTVNIVPGGGVGGSARANIQLPDNAVQNTWLRVTVLANASTALPTNDVFYFGNVIGDLDFGNTANRIRVNGQDAALMLANQSPGANSAGVTNKFDLDRNGRVNGQDTALLLANQQAAGVVAPITAPSSRGTNAFRGSSSSASNSSGFGLNSDTGLAPNLAAPSPDFSKKKDEQILDGAIAKLNFRSSDIDAQATQATQPRHAEPEARLETLPPGQSKTEASSTSTELENVDLFFMSLSNEG